MTPEEPRSVTVSSVAFAWGLVFVLECFVNLHALWHFGVGLPMLLVTPAVGPALTGGGYPFREGRRGAEKVASWVSSAALGAVLGEALGSFIAVPWALTWLCVPGDRYNVATVFLLRLVAVMSALGAWRSERVGDSARLRMDRVAVLASAALMLLVALQQWDGGRSLLGHRPSKEVLAETKAVEQLGPEYADYQFFSRGLRPVFREGRSVTWRASLIAYSTEYRDVLDVDVTWTEPWDQPD